MKLKKVSKILALALVGAMSVTTLTACGGGSNSEAANSSKSDSADSDDSSAGGDNSSSDGGAVNLVMAWWGNQVRNERTQQALDKYHELNSDVTIEGQFFQWDDYWSKLATSAAGKSMPDLIQMDYSYIDQYVTNGQLLDLTPYIESGALDTSNIDESVLEMGKVGDGNYGIAAGINAACMYYNKTVTDECGIEIKDNMTIDEFVEIAKTITEKTGYRAKLSHGTSHMVEWARAEGIPITEAKLPVDSADAYVPFFQILEDGIKEGWHITPDCVEGSAQETEPLVYGSSPQTMAWCTINGGSNLLTAFQQAAPEGVEIGVTTIPTSDPAKSNYLKPAMYFSISADTKNPDAAVAVLNYLINSTEANEILLGERGVPASTAVSDAIYDLISETEQEAYSFVNDVVTPNCSPINPPDPEGSSELSDTLKKIQEKVGYGEITAQEAAEEYYAKGIELWG